jgi:hypothetical protein
MIEIRRQKSEVSKNLSPSSMLFALSFVGAPLGVVNEAMIG